jgi:hypothetical protein
MARHGGRGERCNGCLRFRVCGAGCSADAAPEGPSRRSDRSRICATTQPNSKAWPSGSGCCDCVRSLAALVPLRISSHPATLRQRLLTVSPLWRQRQLAKVEGLPIANTRLDACYDAWSTRVRAPGRACRAPASAHFRKARDMVRAIDHGRRSLGPGPHLSSRHLRTVSPSCPFVGPSGTATLLSLTVWSCEGRSRRAVCGLL